jgi:uncharacterized protein YqgV (UPF0045/DUF77 family)
MNVQAEISMYPLRTQTLTDTIQSFNKHLCDNKLKVSVGPMSSLVNGECISIFQTLGKAFEAVAKSGDVVLIIKVSNACPWKPDK